MAVDRVILALLRVFCCLNFGQVCSDVFEQNEGYDEQKDQAQVSTHCGDSFLDLIKVLFRDHQGCDHSAFTDLNAAFDEECHTDDHVLDSCFQSSRQEIIRAPWETALLDDSLQSGVYKEQDDHDQDRPDQLEEIRCFIACIFVL